MESESSRGRVSEGWRWSGAMVQAEDSKAPAKKPSFISGKEKMIPSVQGENTEISSCS